jgi:hypothetical protein
VGLEQLTTAVDLFIEGKSYISAITLAVAADNIFQRALKKGGQTDVLRWEFELFDQIGLTLRHPDEEKRFRDFRKLKLVERDFANHGPDNRDKRRCCGRS